MGVPKFFRWLSERYPLINQPIHCPPNEETKKYHGFPSRSGNVAEDADPDKQGSYGRKNTNIPHIMPEFDRLYLDMNGIIHCSSHNNSEEELEKQQFQQVDGNGDIIAATVTPTATTFGVPPITEEQIFQNVCYYVDRVVSDIVQPKKVVFLAIDGVAPRAKLNQQRSRRYRSGTEQEIEKHLMTLQRVQEETVDGEEDGINDISKEYLLEADGGAFDRYLSPIVGDSSNRRGAQRFSGTIDTASSSTTTSISTNLPGGLSNDGDGITGFHSNCITPGTPFLHRCSQHILSFLRSKLQTDPRWHDLTIVFSGHDVPGEGEHKIMEFIRHEKHKPGYDPNTSHCIFGQDGDLVMLGLAMHEPHTCLLREEVVFDPARRKAIERLAKLESMLNTTNSANEVVQSHDDNDGEDDGNNGEVVVTDSSTTESHYQPPLSGAVQSYIHNANFELLHISVLREYLGLEFETAEFYPNSRYELEPTIDDFVFMTFFVGNDFLPHMPALDIGDEAFDLLFYAYKRNRGKWLKDGLYNRSVVTSTTGSKEGTPHFKSVNHPYLTDAGTITSGTRLEGFLEDVGRYEDPYYDNKRDSMEEENERMRKADQKAGRESLIPSQEILEQVELAGRESYVDMLLKSTEETGDKDAKSSRWEYEDDTFKPVTSSSDLIKKLGANLRGSLSPEKGGVARVHDNVDESSLVDLKGRYYYEKFGFTPFDAEKHLHLRKAYIAGLVWNLEYYYKGVVSWEWYYPYNYGPMLSDLVNINSILSDVSFFDGEQESESSIRIRRVAGEPLRPFEQLLGCLPPSSSYLLPELYRPLMTSPDSPLIDFYPDTFTVDMNGKRWPWEAVTLLPFIDSSKLIEASRSLDDSSLTEEERQLNEFGKAHVLTRSADHDELIEVQSLENSSWGKLNEDRDVAFRPQLNEGTQIPCISFPTLRVAPINRLNRRKVFLNVFGLRSRYRTALLEMEDELPAFPPTSLLAQKFIGTTVNFRYPILYEGLVCSVTDSTMMYRGNQKPRKFSQEARMKRPQLIAKMFRELQIGEGMTGTGGWILPQVDVTLTVRPLESITTLADGSRAKLYAKREIEIPFAAALFSPSRKDPRLEIPAKLEENPFIYAGQSRLDKLLAKDQAQSVSVYTKEKEKVSYVDKNSNQSRGAKKISVGSARGFSTFPKSPASFCKLPTNQGRPHHAFHSAPQMARRGGPRQRVVGTAGAIVMSAAFFFMTCLLPVNATSWIHSIRHLNPNDATALLQPPILNVRGGDIVDIGDYMEQPLTPPIEFAHGTTTISFRFNGGIVAAVDSRASIGNFVGSKTVQKVLPVSRNILGTMAGGAADCSFWIRFLRSEAKLHELLHEGRGISVARASRLISNVLYQNRGLDLSIGTMIMGYHPRDGFNIYYVDNTGVRIEGDMFAVGSGSTFALGILDAEEEHRFDMTEDEAISLGIKAIRHATLRDAGSGGFIGVYLITKDGWRKVFSEDLASRPSSC